MHLAFDIGNTRVGCGLFDGDEMVARWGFDTDPERPWRAYAADLQRALADAGIAGGGLEAAVAASVVRGMVERLEAALRDLWGLSLIEADPSMDLGIEVAVPVPEAVGIDRLLAAGEAYRLSGGPVILAGLGTAVTIDLVSGDGRFMGGTISPGLRTALWALHARTSLLPQVDLAAPESALGQDTPGCIRAGVVYGIVGGVDRVIAALSQEAEGEPRVLLTGGDARFLSAYLHTAHRVEPDLVLRGLASTCRRTPPPVPPLKGRGERQSS